MEQPICYIVGAGEDYGLNFSLKQDDLLIAADGGYARVRAAGLQPQLVIGDFDSLGKAPGGETVITLPKEKDVTDTWAAIEVGIERGYRCFCLYGCTGGRFEHTLANLQIVADLSRRGMVCFLYEKEQVITGLSGGTLQFGPEHTGFLSVFSHTDRCTGVTLRGLKYELEDAVLDNCFPLGVSNEFTGAPASVTVTSGTALLVYER